MERIGPYMVVRELGRGGMGVVFHARHAELGGDVALKVILAGPDGASGNAIARFETEAQAAGRLSGHPNIAAVTDFGRHDGNLYLAMEFVEGTPLDALVDQGELSHDAAARAVAQTARALHHAHGAGVLHRDVKPANVLIRADGTAKLADFGLARQQAADADVTRLTQSGELLGTPAYMPPEQAKGHGVDARADVYSAGATLYACLTGVPPFQGDSVFAVIAGVMRNEPEPPRALAPATPPGLEAITLKCLAKDPAERYQTAAELADDLERWLAGEPITARERTQLEQAARHLKRHRNPVLIGAGVVAAAALLGAGAWQLARGTEGEAEKLKRETAALTETERAGRVSTTWQQLQRDSGAAMQRLEDRSGGAAVTEAQAAQALQAVRDAAAAARTAAPEVQAVAAWEALALQFAGRTEDAARLLDAAIAAADPAVDPMPRVVRVRIALHRAAATLDPPTVDVGSSSVELGDWELGEAMTAALKTAETELATIPDGAWERLPAAQDDRAFAAGAEAVAAGAWARAETALTPLRDVPAFAAAAGMLGGVAALRGGRYDAAAGWWSLAADRGWPRASALGGIAHVAHAITLHTGGHDPEPALAAARSRLEAAVPHLPNPERALTDLGWTHLLRGTWTVNAGKDGSAPLGEAIRVADAMLTAEPRSIRGLLLRSTAREFLARQASRRMQDVNPLCALALEDLTACDAISRDWPAVWISRARIRLLMAQQRQWRGVDPEPLLVRARAALDRAEQLIPGGAAARSVRADVCQLSAQWKMRHGGDPADDLRLLQEVREAAARAAPRSPDARRELGHCYRMRSHWAERLGEDRGPWLAKALEEFTAAVELNASDDMAFNGRAAVLHERGRFAMRGGGGDAEGDLRAAIRDYGTALELAPGNPDRFSNRGYVRMDLARLLGARGSDAVPAMERAIADYEAALRHLPEDGQVWSNLGSARLELAETLARRRVDPTTALRAAEEAFDAAIRFNPRDAGAYSHRGRLHLFAAKRLRDAGARMAKAHADHDAAVRLNPKDLRNRNARAVFHLTAAHMLRAGGGDPSTHYRSAMEDLEAMLGANPNYLFAHINHTNTCNSYGDWLREQGRDPQAWYAKAYASAKRACALAPHRGDLAGTLALSAEKAGRLEEALTLYERALGLLNHPALRERYDALKRRLGK